MPATPPQDNPAPALAPDAIRDEQHLDELLSEPTPGVIDTLGRLGEYAMSVLGRERIFEYWGQALGTPVALIRLNYAVEMRYGVLLDMARKVWAGEPVDVSMPALNAIWQADANAHTLQAFDH